MSYHTDFLAAMDRTEALGLAVPPIKLTPGSLLTEDKVADLYDEVAREPLRFYHLMHQCIRFHLSETPSVIKVLGVEPAFTLGYVSHREVFFNQFSVEDIRQYLADADPKESSPINVHAWLTLPTLEIIDMTFLTTNFRYFLDQGLQPWMKFITGHPDALRTTMNLAYHPMLVGVNLFEKKSTMKTPGPRAN